MLALLLVGGSACGGSKGKWKQIDLKTVKELLPEMLTAEASFNQRGLEDSLRIVGFQAILSRYGYTLADWDSSLVWYGRHQIVEYQKLYEHAALVLESRQATLQVRVDSLDRIERRRSLWAAHDIDSVNLLRDSASRYLAGSYVERSFALEPSVSYTGGTELRFIVRVSGASPSALQLQLRLQYADSTQQAETLPSLHPGLNQVAITIPSGKTMRAAYGLLRGRLSKSKSPLFVVDSFSLVRYTGAAPEPTPLQPTSLSPRSPLRSSPMTTSLRLSNHSVCPSHPGLATPVTTCASGAGSLTRSSSRSVRQGASS